MIHLYAFAEGLRDLPEMPGLDGAPLQMMRVGGVSAVFSRRTGAEAAASRADALAHGAVVEALTGRARVVLPVRFGETVRDEAALDEAVRGRSDALSRTFERVRDCVEVGVRVLGAGRQAETRAPTGTAYMKRLRTAAAERDEIVEGLHSRLRTIARDARLRRGDVFAATYLLERERLPQLRSLVDVFGADHPELTVVCTGPWAPFSFAEAA